MTAPALLDLQRRMQASVIAQGDTSNIEPDITTPCGITAAQRIGVYVDAYRLRLIEILADDYSALSTWLGEHEFARVAKAYIAAHPSDTRSVRWFGRHLGAFLQDHEADRPLLAELARFEWAQGIAFDAGDAEPVSMQQMAAIPPDRWPQLTFQLDPSVQRLGLHYNVAELFPALVSDQPCPEVRVETVPVCWLIWRRDLKVRWRKLAKDEAAGLDAIAGEADFGRLCEVLCESGGMDETEAPQYAASMLKRWLSDGLIAGVLDHA